MERQHTLLLSLGTSHYYMVLDVKISESCESICSHRGQCQQSSSQQSCINGCLGLPRRLHNPDTSALTHIQQEAEYNQGAGVQAGRDMLQTPTLLETLS